MANSQRILGDLPCEECGSSDAVSAYADGSTKCFSCGHKVWEADIPDLTEAPSRPTNLVDVEIGPHPKRHLTMETCRKFGYGRTDDAWVAQYFDQTGNLVAQKLRLPGKKFSWRGDRSKIGLYGDWLWGSGGKMVVVTEGELDALSVSQVQENRWPVVSVPDGANDAARAVGEALPWLETFERVVLMFDMDEAGRAAAEECARLLSPGKAHIAHLPAKDASDLLLQGNGDAIRRATWDAKPWKPEGIVSGQDFVDILQGGVPGPVAHWPYPDLEEKTLGILPGEIVLLVAGIGAGKSTLCREFVGSFLDQGLRVGVVPLEETIQQFGVGMLGSRIGQNLRLQPGTPLPEEALSAAKDLDLVFFDDHGDRRDSSLFDAIRHMGMSLKCDIVVVDHITMVIGSGADDDRRHAERLILEVESLAKRTQVPVLLVIHLRKTGEGRSHEGGREIQMSDIRGSGMIPMLCHQILAYERDQQAEDRETAWTGQLRVLKRRGLGRTGPADRLKYDEEVGRLVVAPDEMLTPVGERDF